MEFEETLRRFTRGDEIMKKLLVQGLCKYFIGLLFFVIILFVPAGTFKYWNGWVLIAALFVPMLIVGIVLMIKNPELLRKRLNAKEEQDVQKVVVALSGIMFLSAFIVAGLNYRFGWLVVSRWVVIVGTVVFLLAYVMYGEVLRENTYLSRTIEVQENQKVIDTGLYGIIRHPMYSATLFMFLSMGVILGSPISFVILLFYIPIISKRMKNEEKVLEEELEGYTTYKTKVKYKVIPFIW